MFGLNRKDSLLFLIVALLCLFAPILLNPIPVNSDLKVFNAGYPALMQDFVIFAIFAIGFNILFGLTGYLSFGHAAFLGVGSYSAVWMFKLLSFNVIPALILSVIMAGLLSLVIGYVSLRRSGIYFSILTLAFAQMCYTLAYTVLGNPEAINLTGGETGLKPELGDPRILDGANAHELPHLFGLGLEKHLELHLGNWEFVFPVGYYFAAALMLLSFYISIRLFRSPFGIMLRAIKSNQTRMNYTGLNPKPYTLAAFVISGMYAGLAGGLLACMDTHVGADRMVWTASGEVVIMTILGGVGTLLGPILGASVIEYIGAVLSKLNENLLGNLLAWLPDWLEHGVVGFISLFSGEGWHLTLGLLFMIVIIALPGGLVDLGKRTANLFRRSKSDDGSGGDAAPTTDQTPAE